MAETTATAPIFAPIGVRGLRQWNGTVDEAILPALKGPRRRFRTYKEMSSEPMIAASLLGTELMMRQVEMVVTPASDDTAAVEGAAWLHGALFEDMEQSWHETLSEILTMRVYGWNISEILYKRRLGDNVNPQLRSRFTDGKIGWAGFDIRAQDTLLRWIFDDDQRLTGMVQQPETGSMRTLPAEKFLLFRLGQHKGNPEGISLLNNVWRPWYDKQRIREFQNIGIERDLAGYPVMYVPREIMDPFAAPEILAVRQSYEAVIQSIRRNENEGLILPAAFDANNNKLYELKLLSAEGGGRRQFDIPAIVQQLNMEMLMALFTDMLLLGHEKGGGQGLALAGERTSLLGYTLSAILDSICGVINRYATPRLWRLNGFPPETQPLLTHEDIESVDLDGLGRFIAQMATAGLDVVSREEEVWRRAGFPTADEEVAI